MRLVLAGVLLACSGRSPAEAPAAAGAGEAAAGEVEAPTAEETPAEETPAEETPAEETPAETTAADKGVPAGNNADPAYQMYRALSLRDGGPSCAEVEAIAAAAEPPADPVAALVTIVQRAPQPPWVGIRALDCLLAGHGADVDDQLTAWVSGDDTRGYALHILNQIDQLPADVGLAVGRAALAGPHADDARERLAAASDPAISALATQPGGSP